MKSYEVIRQAVEEPGVKAVAAALKVSAALVYKWCEAPAGSNHPEQSGAKNPLDRVKEMYQVTNDLRLIRFLCNEAGGFFVGNPDIQKDKTIDEQIYRHSRKLVRDFSELLDTITSSVEDDNNVDPAEADLIRQRWEDLKMAVEHFVICCEKGHYHREPR